MKNVVNLMAMTIVIGGIGGLAPNKALADTARRFSGNICNPDWNGTDAFNYSVWGPYNAYRGGDPKYLTCGINLDSNVGNVKSVKIYVYDRNVDQNVVCTVALLDNAGVSVTYSPNNHPTLQTSGYANGSNPYTLEWDNSDAVYAQISVRCSIPYWPLSGPAIDASYLTSIEINTSN